MLGYLLHMNTLNQHGEQVACVNEGFGGTREKELLIEVKDGVVQSVQVKKGKPGTPQRDSGESRLELRS